MESQFFDKQIFPSLTMVAEWFKSSTKFAAEDPGSNAGRGNHQGFRVSVAKCE